MVGKTLPLGFLGSFVDHQVTSAVGVCFWAPFFSIDLLEDPVQVPHCLDIRWSKSSSFTLFQDNFGFFRSFVSFSRRISVSVSERKLQIRSCIQSVD